MITKIIGSAGTGKTTTLNEICEEAINVYSPEEIGFFSFAKASIESLVKRFKQYEKKRFKWFRTLHSLCYLLLKQQRQFDLIELHLQELAEDTGLDLRDLRYINEMSYQREEYELFRQYCIARANRIKPEYNDIVKIWEEYKRQHNYLDFYDLIDICLDEKLIPKGIKLLIIDEAQDLNFQQWEYLKLLIEKAEQVYIAGDDDQAIYTFTGSNQNLFYQFNCDDEVYLSTSYRVPQKILQYALYFIETNVKRRYKKQVTSQINNGRIHILYFSDLGNFLNKHSSSNCMIIARCNYMLNDVKKILKDNHFDWYNPYTDNPFFHRMSSVILNNAFKCIDKLLNKEDLLQDEVLDLISIMPVGKFFKKGAKKALTSYQFNIQMATLYPYLKDEVIDAIKQGNRYEMLKFIPEKYEQHYMEWLEFSGKSKDYKRVIIGTIHSVKGGEADVVFLLNDMSQKIVNNLYDNNFKEQEARVWYVGLTRAKEILYIINGEQAFDLGL